MNRLPQPVRAGDSALELSERLEQEFDEWRFGSREGLHAMFIAFVDESEVSAQSVPMIGVGGAIGSGKQWERVAKAWRKALKTEPTVEIFHTNEFETPEGRKHSIYKDWDQQRCQAFGGKLIDTLCENHLEIVSTATVRPGDFAEIAATRPIPLASMVNAYYFCALQILVQNKIWLETYYPGQKITYFFEAGGPQQVGLETAYEDVISKSAVDEFFHFTRKPQFVTKDAFIELQVADKLVYETVKRSSHYLDSEPPEKHSQIHPHIEDARIWNVRYGAKRWAESGLKLDARWYDKNQIRASLDAWNL